MPDLELLANVIVSGFLLGALYGAIALGFAIALGNVGVANLAHPAFVVAGAYGALLLGGAGIDPILASLVLAPVFYAAGALIFRFYEGVFERQGGSALNGMTFFFGLMFVIEVGLLMAFGVDFRLSDAWYVGRTLRAGPIDLPLRLALPCLVAIVLAAAISAYLRLSFVGRAIAAVAQDPLAVRIVGADPTVIRRVAFGIGLATASVAGALLLTASPVQPSTGRDFIGRMFAVCVLGGLGSLRGAMIAGLGLGVLESLAQTYAGAAWANAVGFLILFVALALKPEGLFRR